MKLKIAAMLAGLLMSLSVSGCTAKQESAQEAKVVNLQTVAETLKGLDGIRKTDGELMQVDIKDYEVSQLEAVKDSIEEGFIISEPMSNNLCDMIVLKTTDKEAVKEALGKYVKEDLRYKQFSGGYGSEDNATIMATSRLDSIGDYVYFIAVLDPDKVEGKLAELLQ